MILLSSRQLEMESTSTRLLGRVCVCVCVFFLYFRSHIIEAAAVFIVL